MEKLRRGGAAVKEGGRILAISFLSLLLPLSYLLLARLSAARYLSFTSMYGDDDQEIPFLKAVFLQSKTTLVLSLVVFVVAIGALVRALNSDKAAFATSERRRFVVSWVLITVVQVCLSLGIHGGADVEVGGFAAGNIVLLRRAVFVLGLHGVTLFWRRSAVAPVVDGTVDGVFREGFGWAEEAVLASAFAYLWWRRLRDEVEALVEWTWVGAELEAADALGWLIYYLTAAVGGVRVIKGLVWAATLIWRCRRWKKNGGVNAAVNISV